MTLAEKAEFTKTISPEKAVDEIAKIGMKYKISLGDYEWFIMWVLRMNEKDWVNTPNKGKAS